MRVFERISFSFGKGTNLSCWCPHAFIRLSLETNLFSSCCSSLSFHSLEIFYSVTGGLNLSPPIILERFGGDTCLQSPLRLYLARAIRLFKNSFESAFALFTPVHLEREKGRRKIELGTWTQKRMNRRNSFEGEEKDCLRNLSPLFHACFIKACGHFHGFAEVHFEASNLCDIHYPLYIVILIII